MRGTNIGTGNYVAPSVLAAQHISLVRLVSLDAYITTSSGVSGLLNDYIISLQQQSPPIAVIAVITPESDSYITPYADAYQLSTISPVECDIPDPTQTPPTVPDPARVIYEWQVWYYTYFYRDPAAPGSRPFEDKPLISPPLASGDAQYYARLQDYGGFIGASALDIHPYGKTAKQAQSLLSQYKRITPTLPVTVLEWQRPANQIPEFVNMLNQNTIMNCWFSHDALPDYPAPPVIYYGVT